MINNYKLKYNKEISNPLSQDYINISDKGLVSKYKMNGKLYELKFKGEFSDLIPSQITVKLYAPLILLYGKKYNSHKHLKLINEVIDYSNSKIYNIFIIKNGGMYLKTYFFTKVIIIMPLN